MPRAGETYVSTDIEADGPIPGPHSMLSMASAAFTADGELVGTFTANLELLDGATGDPRTMAWWQTQAAAWEACREGARPPADVMREYVAWVAGLPGRPVFVAYPAGFDFTFVYWYLVRFTGGSPFSHSALDMKTLAMALLGIDYRDATKRAFPGRWKSARKHTHVALDDALEQGETFVKMLAEARRRGGGGGGGGG
jgi:hypothetical protein